MRTKFTTLLIFVCATSIFSSGLSYAGESSVNIQKMYSGFYSREGNDGDMAKTTGNNTYIKFYPENRIVRLYVPYPYSKTVKPATIDAAFNTAVKKSTRSAYIRDKFGVMDELVVAHLDFFRWVDKKAMYDCSKPKPCEITFDDTSMTVIKPGMVVPHKIHFAHMSH